MGIKASEVGEAVAGATVISAGVLGCGFILFMLFLIKPYFLIWGVNGLFGLHIEHNFWNMFYAFLICSALSGGGSSTTCKAKD